MRLRKPLPAWMESLRERAAWFGGQLASLKLTQNIRIPLPIVPLALYSMPHQYLRTLLLADAIRNPGRVGRDMKFLVTPAQTTEDSLRGSPLYEGGTVKGIIFRCSYLEPSTGVLHELQSGSSPPFSPPFSPHAMPVADSSLAATRPFLCDSSWGPPAPTHGPKGARLLS